MRSRRIHARDIRLRARSGHRGPNPSLLPVRPIFDGLRILIHGFPEPLVLFCRRVASDLLHVAPLS